MTKQDAEALLKRHGSIRAVEREAGINRKTLRKCLAGGVARVKAVNANQIAAQSAKGKTLAEFRAQYDKSTIVPAKIKAALKAMGSGKWLYEVEFARAAGVSITDLATFREPFAHLVVSMKDRRAWAGSALAAKQMREML